MSMLMEPRPTPGWESQFEAAQAAEQKGDWDAALRLYDSALELLPMDQAGQRPRLLRLLGRVHFERGEHEAAMTVFERSLMRARELNQSEAAASALNAMAVVAQARGRLDVAAEMYRRASAIAEQLGDSRLCAMIEQNLGTLANTRGDLATALVHYDSALKHFRAIGNRRAAAWVLNNMGMLHVDIEEWAAAELCFDSAGLLAEQQNDHATLGKVATNRAELYLKRQDFERARECCDQAFEIFSRLASSSGLGDVHKTYGILYRETGRLKVAHLQFSLALELARSCDTPLLEAETESERGRAFVNDRSYQSALHSLNRSFQLFSDLDARREIMDLQLRLERLEDTYFRALELWADQELAPETEPIAKRGRRVAELAVAVAKAAGYTQLSALRIGCYMLDVGNAALPAELLERTGPLSADERALVRAHTQRGDDLLEQLGFPSEIRQIVRHHHERFDGDGYPDGLAASDIPLGARIATIADVFDALTSARAWREAYSPAEALRIMQQNTGTQFDPELFRHFCASLAGSQMRDEMKHINSVVR